MEIGLPFSYGCKLVFKVPILETIDHVLFVVNNGIAEPYTNSVKIQLTPHDNNEIGPTGLHEIGIGIVFWQEDELLVIFLLEAHTIDPGLTGLVIVSEVVIVRQTDNIGTGRPRAVALLSGREYAVIIYVDLPVLEVFNDLIILGFKFTVIPQGSPIHRLQEADKVIDRY